MGLSVRPYIGTRDFYPEQMVFRNTMFECLRNVSTSYGYSEYNAPLIESVDLYRLKTSEEIVNEQLYSFSDRGGREVAIRPEMTPTLARMVSSQVKKLSLPLRWFSIANFMRYERPGRGRLREFYQLNVDHLGSIGPAADAEILMMAIDILRAFGADHNHFRVLYNHRKIIDSYFKNIPAAKKRNIGRIIDKKAKVSEKDFRQLLFDELSSSALADEICLFLELDLKGLTELGDGKSIEPDVLQPLLEIATICENQGYGDFLQFDPTIMRGFDYYTGFIFEIFDRHPENRRSIFGGGRYDRLIGLFGKEDIAAVGFGLGDVTLENFLEKHQLYEKFKVTRKGIYLTLFSQETLADNMKLAHELRDINLEVELALEPTKRIGKQFEIADKKNKKIVLLQGPDEIAKGMVRVKNMETGEQIDVKREELGERLLKTIP